MRNLNNIKRALASLIADCEQDAINLEGKPFTGKTVGESFGVLFATINALAAATIATIDKLIEMEDKK